MRNKILSIVIIALMIQFLMPALALAEDLPIEDPNLITPAVADSAPLVEAAPAPIFQMPNNPLCEGITGDLNGDGLINKYDTEVVVKMMKGLEPFNPCADLNGDGYIGAGDVSNLIETYKVYMPVLGIVLEPKVLNSNLTGDSASGTCTLGDANGDNKIDYKDVGLLLQMMKGELPGTPAADLDGDGFISPADWSQLEFATRFTHKASADVTAEEKGNCEVPTAKIVYSKDNGVTFSDTIKVKKGDILMIKTVFSSGLNEFEYAFLDLDNGLGADIFMTKLNTLESVYNLEIKTDENITAAVSIKTINGVFTDNIVLTSGNTFVINKGQTIVNSGSDWTPGSFPSCEVINYSEWSEPVDGKSTREVTSKVPFDCILSDSQVTSLEKIVSAEPLIEENPEVNAQVLGIKLYPDGSLLRANDYKIYIIELGFKRHINTLTELAAKYLGQAIIKVTPEELAAYPDVPTNTK